MSPDALSSLDYAKLALTALTATIAASGLGAAALALWAELRSTATKQVFLDKYAKQTAAFGLAALLGTLALPVSALIMAWHKKTPFGALLERPLGLLLIGLGAAAVLGVAVYGATWPKPKAPRTGHLLVGGLGVGCGLSLLVAAVAFKRKMLAFGPSLALDPSIESFFKAILDLNPESLVWAVVGFAVPFALAAGAAFSLLYIIARRNVEDLGRDYYNYAVKRGAKIAALLAVLAALPGAWLAWRILLLFGKPNFSDPFYITLAAGLCALLLAAVPAGLVAKDDNPLRRKPAMLLAAVLVWGAAAAFTLTLARFIL